MLCCNAQSRCERPAIATLRARKCCSMEFPFWLAMAPMVRETMVQYQAAIANPQRPGQLASMQNKFVRLALERLRLSVKEFLSELPESMNTAYIAATAPADANRSRLLFLRGPP